MCAIGTPHIAGYSIDGKVNATKMILQVFCKHFDLRRPGDFSPQVSPPEHRVMVVDGLSSDVEDVLAGMIKQCYDIEKDDKALRTVSSIDLAERGTFFKKLRSNYHFRHEFSNFTVKTSGEESSLNEILRSFGFRISSDGN